ncbi:MAG: hypothetical protein ACYC7L_04675 [Nitrospirota bacterium]
MKRSVSFIVVAALAAAVMLMPNAFGVEQAKQSGKVLFEQKCLKCHKIAKFKDNTSDRKGWVLTLNRMQRGICTVTDAEIEVLADYLADVYGE